MGLIRRGECSKCHRTRPHRYSGEVCMCCEEESPSEACIGTLGRFSLARFKRLIKRVLPSNVVAGVDYVVTEPTPSEEKTVYKGTIVLNADLIGRLWAGNSAFIMRDLGMKIADEVPDFAVINKDGEFEWSKIEFTLPPKETE